MKLIEALAAVSQADLDEIIAEMSTLEGRMEQLKEVRKLIELKLGLRKPIGANFQGRGKKPQATVAAESNGSEPPGMSNQLTVTEKYRIDAQRFIMANGPQTALKIAKACEIPTGSITAVLKHRMFKQSPHGYELSNLM